MNQNPAPKPSLKAIVWTGAILVIAIAVPYTLLVKAGQRELALAAVAAIAGLIPPVHQYLEHRTRNTDDGLGNLKRFDEFTQPPQIVLLYASAWFLAAVEGASMLGGLMALSPQADDFASSFLSVGTSSMAVLLCGYQVGKWIGIKSRRYGKRTIVAIAFGVKTFDSVAMYPVMSSAEFRTLFGVEKSVGILLIFILGGGAFISAVLFVGYRVGVRSRSSAYLAYIFRKLSPQDRRATLELVHDSVRDHLAKATSAPTA